jgi:two-component system chemotaxis sensor kinase CheA
VRLEGEQARRGVESIHGAPVYRLRGNLLPLVYLHRQLRVEGDPQLAAGAEAAVNIVVLQADDHTFGLVVDEINDTEEIVVKPLGKQLKGVPLYAGATILGDGRVALILDVMGLAQGANVVQEQRERALPERSERPGKAARACQTLLLLAMAPQRRLAVPLTQVARLEEFAVAAVEHSGRFEAVQYRGQIMPLVRLAQVLPGCAATMPDADPLQVVVYSGPGRRIGLVVERILDIVEAVLDLDPSMRAPGLLGTAIIDQRLTDVLDVPGLLALADPVFAQPHAPELQEA